MKRILLAVLFLCCIIILPAQNVGDYQTAGSGNWNTVAVWQTWNGTAWVTPGGTPNNTNGVITILAGHTITVPAALTVDELTVNGTMNLATTVTLTIANGTGVDMQINGTFGDLSNTSIVWNAGATWQMGASGTLIKTTASSSNNWQSNYQGGIANIPSTSNWILRKIGTQQPALSTTTPASGSVYPNLIIECTTAAAWIAPAGSSFTGTTAAPTIKGNLDIGGSGSNTLSFLSSNTFTNPVMVNGNLVVRPGNILRNYGTGFEVQGDLTVNGAMVYDANDARKLVFSGSNNQTINGTGTLFIYDLTLNKSAGTVTLNRPITVNNLSTFTGGIMVTTSTNLLNIAATGTVAAANNASFVSGPVRYLGSNAMTFPVGKNSDYQPIGISSFTPTGGPFWTETFSNGCANACFMPYNGPNGQWVSTATGFNAANSNKFFVSGAECGNAATMCGTGCGTTDPSLHVGNNDGIVGNDGGARYDAGGLCPSFACVTADMRAESPVINCTGHVNVYLAFNYLENGSGTVDNATLWYFDGSTWSQLIDLPKTLTVCSPQGQWTAFAMTLPSSADNNPNVQIGFRWVNNDDGVGSDPTFAVDDITLGSTPESFTAEYFYANPQVVYNNNLAPTLSSISACEYWILDRSPATSTATTSVTLTWDGNSCPAIPQVSDTRVAHFDLVTWQDEGNGGNTGTTAAGTVTSAAAVTYFSPFTIGLIPATPLPIQLIRFDGTCKENTVLLNWSTASETDNDYFTIERSTDGISFSAIGNRDGAGNSMQVLHYHFEDTDPFAGMNYYRIKQTDYNGQFAYSGIIAVDAKACENINLQLVNAFFNTGNLTVDYRHAAGPVTIEIYNAEGMLIDKAIDLPPDAAHHINAAGWSSAFYFVRVTDGVNTVSRTLFR